MPYVYRYSFHFDNMSPVFSGHNSCAMAEWFAFGQWIRFVDLEVYIDTDN